jgi:predicted metal-dependent peptidase
VIGVDTSGSISQDILSAFAKEINTIMGDAEPDLIHIVYCDAAVHRVDTYNRGDTIEIKPVGGGGTDFSPVFRWVEENGVNPMCLIYFTDLMGSFPGKPDYPVIWAATMDGNIPWGEKIQLNTTDQ